MGRTPKRSGLSWIHVIVKITKRSCSVMNAIPGEVGLHHCKNFMYSSYQIITGKTGVLSKSPNTAGKPYHRVCLGAMVLETSQLVTPVILRGRLARKWVFSQMLAENWVLADFLVIVWSCEPCHLDSGPTRDGSRRPSGLTGRPIRWPELAEAAGNAQPVILLVVSTNSCRRVGSATSISSSESRHSRNARQSYAASGGDGHEQDGGRQSGALPFSAPL